MGSGRTMAGGVVLGVALFLLPPAVSAQVPASQPPPTTAAAGDQQTPESEPGDEPARRLHDTLVTLDLDKRLDGHANVIWCSTMQLAWNELSRKAGKHYRLAHEQPSVLDRLNAQMLDAGDKDIDPASCVMFAGARSEQNIQHVRDEIARKFGGRVKAELLPEPLSDGMFAYSLLYKDMAFAKPFTRTKLDGFPSQTKTGYVEDDRPGNRASAAIPVAAFGIEGDGNAALRKQVHVLWHRFHPDLRGRATGEMLIIELSTQTPEDRLILALVPPEPTLHATIDRTLARMAHPNRGTARFGETEPTMEQLSSCAELLDTEDLLVPVLNLDVTKDFQTLYGKRLDNGHDPDRPAFADGQTFESFVQKIRFRLDERGVKLKSEAQGGWFGGPPVRRFTFDQPFLVMLMRKDAAMPYFAAWIANDELMRYKLTAD